ncbi:MAG: hypothetical protein P8I93_00315 [Crocinitomicaceae bacterium]|nr:hypothetical protein [Crocinitomicaceae bacterium]
MSIKLKFLGAQIITIIGLLFFSFLTLQFDFLSLDNKKHFFVVLSCIGFAIIGTSILWKEIGHRKKEFVVKFIISTTIQFLYMLSVFLYLIYGLENTRNMVLHLLFLFLIQIVSQSIILFLIQKK